MKQIPYTLTELIQSDDFISWVLHPDEASNRRWEEFLTTFPEKKETVENAKGYVILLAEDTGRHKPTPEQSDRMRQVVQSYVHEAKEEDTEDWLDSPKSFSGWKSWRIAATVTLLIGIGAASYLYWGPFTGSRWGESTIASADSKTSPLLPNAMRRVNNTDMPMTVILTDGSSIVLLPGGVLDYSAEDLPNRREVFLSGRAFFEIVKNRDKPFYVYTGGIATKVLGTSFLIDAPADSEAVNVEVKTGRVAVFPHSLQPDSDRREVEEKAVLEGLVLGNDEKVSVSRLNGKPVQAVTDKTTQLSTEDISKKAFFFDETPVSTVFAELEQAYNIRINYDAKLMADCPLNATLVGEPFLKKLTVICAALDAKFEINADQVFITGKGCR
ncbi:FecR family protein [Persicitalea jodogahamensis]|uniref:Anti-sigma factor n=1 Tax=Persicitalea jodogahamensis TaxID=402147 RepID=A0A8J3DC67_9BACT|nr:FecR family protein [Persicitalea jodogahamensis]GHB82328.1 anti-sigma factor [Persicitalea jodogahamensis]